MAMKIAIAFSDTGGGHRSAADAIETAINDVIASDYQGKGFEVVSENVVERTHPINRAFVDFYNYLLRQNQQLMKYYYWFIHFTKPNDSELGYRISGPYLRQWLRREQPAVVVSVHPMTNQYMARAMKDTGMFGKTKLVTVVTDPNGDFWKGWACADADITVVPNGLGKTQLCDWGVPQDKIRVMGMPISPDFIKPPTVSKQEFRQHLGLHPERPTICINAGWAGGGNMLAIFRELMTVQKDIQVIFLCGHNQKLYERVKREARRATIPCAVLPFHDRMSDLMSAVDLMVTKAGGLTTFEAIARRLPLAIDVITKPMPQEAGTVKILVDNGLGYAIGKADDIVEVVENLQPVADRNTVKLPAVHSLDRTDAVYDIARSILHCCDPALSPKASTALESH